jgi:hypothetical protein
MTTMPSKKLTFVFLLAVCAQLHAQTNTFPASGNVGIGTTTPQTNLDVQGNGSDSQDLLRITRGNGNQSRVQIGHCYIQRYDDSGTPNSLVINANGGNVGIGTTSPSRPLEVAGQIYSNIATGGSLALNGNNTNSQPSIYFQRNNSSGWSVGLTSDANASFYIINSYGGGNVMTMSSSGNVGIGTTTPQYPLDVPNGAIHANEVIVDTSGADYVFKSNYKLMPLSQVEQAIKKDQHLPGIPSAQEMSAHGVSVGDLQTKLLAKVEELTLHVIAQQKELDALKAENAAMQARLSTIAK